MQLRTIIFILMSFSLAKAQTVALAADSLSGLPGTPLGVPVRVSGFVDMVSFQGTLEWDTAVVSYAGVAQFGLTGLNGNSFGTTLTNAGKLTFSWDDGNLQGVTVTDSTVLFEVEFDLTGPAGTSSTLTFSNSPTALEFIDVNFNAVPVQINNGAVTIEDTTVSLLNQNALFPSSLNIFPNPITPQTVVEFDGGLTGGNVVIELWAVSGKMMRAVNVNAVPGLNRIQLTDGIANGISRGIYWINCSGGNGFFRQKLIVE